MSGLVWIGVALLGGLGAAARFAVDGAVGSRAPGAFPLGTLAVNLSGAVVLGALTGAVTDAETLRLAATGLLGAYTTFSTWVFESHRLAEDGELSLAWANLALSAVLGLAALWAGMQVGEAL